MEGMELSKLSLAAGRVRMVTYTFLIAHPKMTYTSPYDAEEVVWAVDDGIQRQIHVVANLPIEPGFSGSSHWGNGP